MSRSADAALTLWVDHVGTLSLLMWINSEGRLKVVDDEFMARPTDVFVSYLARRFHKSESSIVSMLRIGRIAMAMEILTTVQVIEDHSVIASKYETIAVLETLLRDQGLDESAEQWYEFLARWRTIKFHDAVADASVHNAPPSELASPQDDALPHEASDAPHGSDQSQDPT
jgi:hypothetical protein